MDLSTNTAKPTSSTPAEGGDAVAAAQPPAISLRAWFYSFAGYLLALSLIAQWMLHISGASPLPDRILTITIFTLYLSLCCTFIPLPTSPMIVLLSGQVGNIAPGSLWITMLAVATAGAIGSTMANLNDYHIIVGLLRYRRLAKVRDIRLYKLAVKWFEHAPFALQVIFNIVPVPVDVVRILAASNYYPRLSFAAANFIGRFVRYAVLASLTFIFNWGKFAALAMLGIAAVFAIARFLWGQMLRIHRIHQTRARDRLSNNV